MNRHVIAKRIGKIAPIKRGDFYIFKCNRDIISGYALDCPPNSLYVSRFILPTFDKHEFLHLSLSERIVSSTRDVDPDQVMMKIQTDWQSFRSISRAEELLNLLRPSREVSPYHRWAYFLSICRVGDFDSALATLSDERFDSVLSRWKLVSARYKALKDYVLSRDEKSVEGVLNGWQRESQLQYCEIGAADR